MRLGGALIASATLLTAPAGAAAQDPEPICADRPGKATGTCTVPAGLVQVETGLVHFGRDRSGGVRSDTLTIGDTAVKLGVSDRLHLELDVTPYSRARVRGGAVTQRAAGFGDIGLRLKYRLTADDAPVQVAVNPFVKVPTAKRPLGNGKVEGGVVVPVEWAIPRSPLSLTLSPELDVVADGDGSGHHLAAVQAVSLGVALSRRLSVSADLWRSWDFDPAGTVRHYSLGPSAGYLLSDDVQLDAGVDFGLNRAAPDVEIYSGIALRF